MGKVNALFQDERDAAGEGLIAAGVSPEDAHERTLDGGDGVPVHAPADGSFGSELNPSKGEGE